MDKILWNFLWQMLQNKLQQMGVNTQWVNFNDMNSINDFASKILPWMIKNNPQMKEIIKQNLWNLDKDKQEEVMNTINSI
jgi:hypothetical protein